MRVAVRVRACGTRACVLEVRCSRSGAPACCPSSSLSPEPYRRPGDARPLPQHTGGFRSQERVFLAQGRDAAKKRDEAARAAELKQVCPCVRSSLSCARARAAPPSQLFRSCTMLPCGERAQHRRPLVTRVWRAWQDIEREQQRKLLRATKDESDPASMREKVGARGCLCCRPSRQCDGIARRGANGWGVRTAGRSTGLHV